MSNGKGPYRIFRYGPFCLLRLLILSILALCILGCERSAPPASEETPAASPEPEVAPPAATEPLPELPPVPSAAPAEESAEESVDNRPESRLAPEPTQAEIQAEPVEPATSIPKEPHPPLRLIVNGQTITRPLMSVSVLPRQRLSIAIDNPQASYDYHLVQAEKKPLPAEESEWLWLAPSKPGLQSLTIKTTDGSAAINLQVFVLTSFSLIDEDEADLNGYMIGEYPDDPKDDNPIYLPPSGFIEVTLDNEETWVSPHFQLKQFLCKQKGGYPKYVVLQTALLQKLEAVIEHLANRGHPVDTLHVMSGYRTPEYNDDIGNSDWSRHVWGDAADVFIDQNHDDQMDDINGDGQTTDADVRLFYNLVNEMDVMPEYASQIGGLGYYGAKSWRTGFIHIDTRGSQARW